MTLTQILTCRMSKETLCPRVAMEEQIRAEFESALGDALASDDPHFFLSRAFARKARHRRGGRPSRRNVDTEERRRSLLEFINSETVEEPGSWLVLDDVKVRFDAFRRKKRLSRIAWTPEILEAIGVSNERIDGLTWTDRATDGHSTQA